MSNNKKTQSYRKQHLQNDPPGAFGLFLEAAGGGLQRQRSRKKSYCDGYQFILLFATSIVYPATLDTFSTRKGNENYNLSFVYLLKLIIIIILATALFFEPWRDLHSAAFHPNCLFASRTQGRVWDVRHVNILPSNNLHRSMFISLFFFNTNYII